MQGKKDYQEKLFIRFQLSDHIPADNLYRLLKDTLDLRFLYQDTAKYYGTEGQKSIDPVVFMKLMLVGYLENINSDRRIISSSRMRMDVLYFLGYDLDEELPWHSTLSRTRKLYGQQEFVAIFKQVLKLCIDKGLVSGKRQAVDSVLVKANASIESVIEKQILDDVQVYSEELESNNEQEPDQDNLPPKPPVKRRAPTNSTHYSPSDPDARFAVKPRKPYDLYYRSQVSVDTASHCITYIQAFHADKGDSRCFPEVLGHVIANMEEHHIQVEEVLADTGYSSTEALQSLQDNHITGYIPNISGYRTSREGFTYDHKNDRYTCSQGINLTFRRMRYAGNKVHKIYQTSKKDCKDCPFKTTCANPVGIKSLEDAASKHLYDQMLERLSNGIDKHMRNLRSGTVEPVLGTLVNFTAMKKVYTKSIASADKCMIMAATAYNLKKLLKKMLKTNKPNPSPKGIGRILYLAGDVFMAIICFFKTNLFEKQKEQITFQSFALLNN
ncbi:IS1182 family transposase [Mucilaginibacter sabulilitoris]|uniref:IS1182 family transposase n=1 Tax=Mucilaginibacter sabulilitoris TaxID=1173583 RepID=A0ABZ0TID3_9SPHI|nr:IS1182 family transposase [Mucilaginibacter sabulilitoris]WPU92955.1 IS1182 family transposase [Mucilaginibacter sabulilitoris]